MVGAAPTPLGQSPFHSEAEYLGMKPKLQRSVNEAYHSSNQKAQVNFQMSSESITGQELLNNMLKEGEVPVTPLEPLKVSHYTYIRPEKILSGENVTMWLTNQRMMILGWQQGETQHFECTKTSNSINVTVGSKIQDLLDFKAFGIEHIFDVDFNRLTAIDVRAKIVSFIPLLLYFIAGGLGFVGVLLLDELFVLGIILLTSAIIPLLLALLQKPMVNQPVVHEMVKKKTVSFVLLDTLTEKRTTLEVNVRDEQPIAEVLQWVKALQHLAPEFTKGNAVNIIGQLNDHSIGQLNDHSVTSNTVKEGDVQNIHQTTQHDIVHHDNRIYHDSVSMEDNNPINSPQLDAIPIIHAKTTKLDGKTTKLDGEISQPRY